jgi:hypothetical protein
MSMAYHHRIEVRLDRLVFKKQDYEQLRAAAQRPQGEAPDRFSGQQLGGTLNMNGGHAFGQLWSRKGTDHPEWFALAHCTLTWRSRHESFLDRRHLHRLHPVHVARC